MDVLHNLINTLKIYHYNAAVTLYWFVLSNIAIVILATAMLFIYKWRMKFQTQLATKLTKRRFNNEDIDDASTQIATYDEDTLNGKKKVLLVKYAVYVVVIAAATVISSPAILYSTTLMWTMGALSVRFLKGDREELSQTVETYTVAYVGAIMLIEILLWFNTGVSAIGSTSLHKNPSAPATTSAVMGYLPMARDYIAAIVPILYGKTIWEYWQKYSAGEIFEKEMSRQMRTGNQKKKHEEENYRNY